MVGNKVNMLETKQKIENAIKDINTNDLFESSIALFSSIGYDTRRQGRLDNTTYEEFEKNFLDDFL